MHIFKELACTTVGARKPESCRAGWQAAMQTGVNVAVLRQNSFFSRKPQHLWPSTDWVRPTHVIKENLTESQLTVHHIYEKNAFTATL